MPFKPWSDGGVRPLVVHKPWADLKPAHRGGGEGGALAREAWEEKACDELGGELGDELGGELGG